MYPPITYELLKSKRACKNQLDLVKEHFGMEPIPLTDKVIDEFSSTFDVAWAARHLLTNNDLALYLKSKAVAFTKLDSIYTAAISIYRPIYEECQVAYMKDDSDAVSYRKDVDKHIKIETDALADYRKAYNPAAAEYNTTVAREFVRIYKAGMT